MSERIAGRELDALIAERVMGETLSWWDVVDEGGERKGLVWGNEYRRPTREEAEWYAARRRGWKAVPVVVQYSEDIEYAMQVVDAMRAKGWRWRIGTGDENPEHVYAAFWKARGFLVQHSDEAPTAALAICRAALATLDDPENLTPDKAQLSDSDSSVPLSPGTPEK